MFCCLKELTFTNDATFHFHGGVVKLTKMKFTNISMAIDFYECVEVDISNIQFTNVTTQEKEQLIQTDSCLYAKFRNITISQSTLLQTLVLERTLYVLLEKIHVFSTQGELTKNGIILDGISDLTVKDLNLFDNNNLCIRLSQVESSEFQNLTLSSNSLQCNDSTKYFILLEDSKVTMKVSVILLFDWSYFTMNVTLEMC